MITAEEVWASGLPPATTLVAGDGGLSRVVTWVAAMRSRAPGFVGLKGGELALLSTRGLRELDSRLTLPEVLERLADAGVAAAAVQGEVGDLARAVADQRGLPLLALPREADLHEVERQVTRLLLEQRVDLHRRGHELASQLNELVIEGRSSADLVDRLAMLSGRPVTLETLVDEQLHLAGPRGLTIERAELAASLAASRPSVLAWANRQSFSASDPPVARFELAEARLARLVAPLGQPDGLVGLLSILAPTGQMGELERLAAARGAAACALALARERAVLATEDRLQRDLIDELLAEREPDSQALSGRASRLGYNFDAPHLVLQLSLGAAHETRGQVDLDEALSRAAELVGRSAEGLDRTVPLRRNGTTLTALLPLTQGVDERRARQATDRLHQALVAQLRPAVVSLGAAGPRVGVEGLRLAHREAERALTLGAQLFGAGHLTHFADLGLYRLLYQLHDTPETAEFLREMIGMLESYDLEHSADLLLTLEAYFAAGASPKETASRLHVHRNTVLYRLQRIVEISGHRLDDPSTCLGLQLALRLRHTLPLGEPKRAEPLLLTARQ